VRTAASRARQFGVGKKTNRFCAMHAVATTNCTRFSSLGIFCQLQSCTLTSVKQVIIKNLEIEKQTMS